MQWFEQSGLLLASLIVLASAVLTGATLLLSTQAIQWRPQRARVVDVALVIATALCLLLFRAAIKDAMFVGFVVGWLLVVIGHVTKIPSLRIGLPLLGAACFGYGVFVSVESQSLAIAMGLLAALTCVALPRVWTRLNHSPGLSIVSAIVVFAACVMLAGGFWIPFALCMVAVCLGILPWTFPRDIVSLGSLGASSLGYIVAGVSIAMLSWMPTPDATLKPGWLLVRNLALVSLPLMPSLVDATVRVAGQPFTQLIVSTLGASRAVVVQFLLSAAGLLLMLWLWPRDHSFVLWVTAGWIALLLAMRLLYAVLRGAGSRK